MNKTETEYLIEYLCDTVEELRDDLEKIKRQMKAAKESCPCRLRTEPECDG